ncbi:hypothetical protein [Hyalangium gracile]|uniref:hypothetical protein n=1 Tax=Hyalangium gracile TaxID=394092 RepID=UPI001CCE149F|nr:hypothetical protein [Hyalangium gracile]
MTPLSTATALLLWLATQAPQASKPPAPAPPPLEVRHVPLAQVFSGRGELVLEAEVTPAFRLGQLVAHHRVAGQSTFQETAFTLIEPSHYAATLPLPPEQRAPVEYYLTVRDTDGKQSFPFASAEAPHTVLIQVPDKELEREALLASHGHRRSRVALFAEYVDYGSTRAGTVRYLDRYYRLEADYLHRLLTDVAGIRVDSIRIGVGHLRARIPPSELPIPSEFPPLEIPPTRRTGLDYGFSELEVSLSPHFGYTTRLVLGGNAEGFAAGLGGRLRIGPVRGSHVELEGETTSGLGSSGTVRLAWDTVPRVPMSAAIQVTSFPDGPTGVRLLYRADFELSPSLTLGAQVGYQARISISGGPTLGLASSYAW